MCIESSRRVVRRRLAAILFDSQMQRAHDLAYGIRSDAFEVAAMAMPVKAIKAVDLAKLIQRVDGKI
jgi:hypothetical protein